VAELLGVRPGFAGCSQQPQHKSPENLKRSHRAFIGECVPPVLRLDLSSFDQQAIAVDDDMTDDEEELSLVTHLCCIGNALEL
jgi:hypothetical protein